METERLSYESLVGGMLTKEEYASYKAKYQVAESSQIDLCVFQQLVSRQHLLVGIQCSRFVR